MAVALGVLYLLCQNRSYGYDSCSYAESIKYGLNLFHPHHLIYNYIFHQFYRIIQSVSSIPAMTMAAFCNAVAMAINVFLFGRLIAEVTKNPRLTVAFALFYGVCYSCLYVATSVEVYPWNVLLNLLGFVLLSKDPATTPWRAVWVGVLSGVAVLFHQTAIFAALALFALLLWRRDRPLVVLLYATVSMLCCAGPYLWAATQAGLGTARGLLQLVLAYTQSPQYHAGIWGHGLSLHRLPMALLGILSTFSYPRLDYLTPLYDGQNIGINIPYLRAWVIAGCLVLIIGLLLIAGVRFINQRKVLMGANMSCHKPLLSALWVWLISHGLFTWWWNAENLEFWFMALAPFLVILACRVARCRQPLYSPLQRGLLLSLFSIVNLGFRVLPDARASHSPVFQCLAALNCSALSDGDWFIGPMPEVVPCLRYRCGRALAFHSLSYEFYASAADKEPVRRRYADRLAQAVRERVVYLQEEELWPEVLSPQAEWSAAEARTLYAPYLAGAQILSTYVRDGRRYRLFRLAPPQHGGASNFPTCAIKSSS